MRRHVARTPRPIAHHKKKPPSPIAKLSASISIQSSMGMTLVLTPYISA